MAHKYFSQKLLAANDIINLSEIFPEKQEMARDVNNVTYSLGDIVMFIKDKTKDFTQTEREYIDLDVAISEIVSRYYKSISQPNPFLEMDEQALADFVAGKVPREAVVVEAGKIKGTGLPSTKAYVKPIDIVSEQQAITPVQSTEIEAVKELAKTAEETRQEWIDAVEMLELIGVENLDEESKEALELLKSLI